MSEEYRCSVEDFNNKISPYLDKVKVGKVEIANTGRPYFHKSFIYFFQEAKIANEIKFAQVKLNPSDGFIDLNKPLKIDGKCVLITLHASEEIKKELEELLKE